MKLEIFCLLFSLPIGVYAENRPIDSAAKVNDLYISISEYEQASLSMKDKDDSVPSAEARQAAIDKLIAERLLIQKADVLGIRPTKKELDEGVSEIKSRFKKDSDGEILSDKEAERSFIAALKTEGVSYREFRQRIELQLMAKKLIERKVPGNLDKATRDSAIKKYIDGLKSEAIIEIYVDVGKSDHKTPYAQMAAELLKGVKDGQMVALTPFSLPKMDMAGYSVVTDRILSELVKAKKTKIIERKEIEKVFAELKLQQSGMISPESAKEIGKILGADVVGLGNISELENGLIEVNARMVAVPSGEILSSTSRKVSKDWKGK